MTTDSADRAEWLKQPEAEARRGRQTTKSGRTLLPENYACLRQSVATSLLPSIA